MVLLSASQRLVGVAQSTFTYLAYARALAAPVLTAFRQGEAIQMQRFHRLSPHSKSAYVLICSHIQARAGCARS